MSTRSPTFLGFVDGSSRHTHQLASAAWVIFSPDHLVVSSGGACLGPTSNNVVEYSAIIELLQDAISHDIQSLEVLLDSQLVVSQLNGQYRVRDPTLLRIFLKVRLLERHFVSITYIHILRSHNYISDAYANYVLDWHLSHST